ncbi:HYPOTHETICAL PROTEIN MCJ_007260 [Mesomycoplasma conjunctivae]|uniref:MATE efflux family protein n=1 Tax=Mesomycoplasma conjunctivae (strain ATCC 25834 / NCTC 10147 / HRC/581) TaxID=572263 RepID=C5J7E5_MESCH|nr:MATE family efflux transporter [Mesomycoplasma conjunctivae]CAT05408.1 HYPOTHETICAL PROTEIN MCJ_007260 [Mesomycoplasma conjunctivae]
MHFLHKVKSYFPNSAKQWKLYSKITIPLVLSSLFISLNNFVDNFMVSQISGGVTAIGLANVWTGIAFSFLASINVVGSIIFSQYWGKKDFIRARQINNIRLLLNIFFALLLGAFAWSMPDKMIELVQKNNTNVKEIQNTITAARQYLFVIAFSWVLFAYTITTSSMLRESGSIRAATILTFMTLAINVILNLILIPSLGIVGSALATVIARGITAPSLYIYQYFYKKEVRLIIWEIFSIKKEIWYQFIKRFPGLILTVIASVSISLRAIFWSQGLPQGSIGIDSMDHLYIYWGIGFITVSGITSTISTILLVAFASIQSNVSINVGRKLGLNQIEEAKSNAKMLKGYMFIFSIFLSAITFILILILTQTNLLTIGIEQQVAKGLNSYFEKNQISLDENLISQQQKIASQFYLEQIFWVGLMIVLINPLWVQINTSMSIISSGGRSNFSSLWNFGLALFQVLWQVLDVFIFLPFFTDVSQKLIITTLIFYSSDIIKWIVFETIYLKVDWARNITINNKVEGIN